MTTADPARNDFDPGRGGGRKSRARPRQVPASRSAARGSSSSCCLLIGFFWLTTPPEHLPLPLEPDADRPLHLRGRPARDRPDVRDRHRRDRPLDRRHRLPLRRLRRRGDAAPVRDERAGRINGEYPHASLGIAVGVIVCVLTGAVCGLGNGIADHEAEAAAVHRHARNARHHLRARRGDRRRLVPPRAGPARPLRRASAPASSSGSSTRSGSRSSCLVVAAHRVRLHALRPLHARGRLERGGHAPRRHLGRPGT